ncbi:MAG TPA: lycopene cyclase domain-containing protein, partial [Bacteroidia bacterium]|nr:lycopene cyclase domain-containing protein [Bacteroidia bacterium]
PRQQKCIPFILVSAFVSLCYYDRMYTFAAAGGLALLLVFVRFFYKAEWLGKFYFIYLVLMIPFMIVNGILTGTGISEPIVWYNDDENMGIRMLTIPLEDVFYGMTLILLNVLGFEFLKSRFGIHVKKVV